MAASRYSKSDFGRKIAYFSHIEWPLSRMDNILERSAPGCQTKGQSVRWTSGSPLPAELDTGHAALDFEHRQLLACMTATRQVCLDLRSFTSCAACIPARRQQCDAELVRLLGDLLAFILDHFKHEEAVMRESLLIMVDKAQCEAHIEDHAAISSAVQRLVAAIDRQATVINLRELDDLLGRWITHHIGLHDVMLMRWVAREDSALRSPA